MTRLIRFSSVFLAILVSSAAPAFASDLPGVLDIDFDLAKVPKVLPKTGKPLIGQTITIDTRNQSVCAEIRDRVSVGVNDPRLSDLCAQDQNRPFSTIVTFREQNDVLDERVIRELTESELVHANNSKNVVLLQLAILGRYHLEGLPDHWKNPEGKSIDRRWADNIRRGPVKDGDNFRTNYIEHPIAGSVYYTIARHDGFSPLESFAFSAFTSTFLWEYGLEAIYEPPSINDLIVTPVVGSLLGEVFYQVHQAIERNDGRVLGSPFVGRFIQIVTNPGYYLSEALDAGIGGNTFESGDLSWVIARSPGAPQFTNVGPQPTSNAILLRLRLQFRVRR